MGDEELIPFDAGSAPAGVAVTAAVARTRMAVRVRYTVRSHQALRLPPPATAARRRDDLWRHTCFEAFLAPAGAASYHELNLAPSGDWNLYAFARYRDGMAPEARVSSLTGFRAAADGDRLHVEATLDLAPLPALAGDLDIGLCAVLQAAEGTLSYWALRHPGAQPDFHRRDSFVLRLAGAAA